MMVRSMIMVMINGNDDGKVVINGNEDGNDCNSADQW